eukprot:scaffold7805_cov153-Amphora_coffeaeformis.AAC.2
MDDITDEDYTVNVSPFLAQINVPCCWLAFSLGRRQHTGTCSQRRDAKTSIGYGNLGHALVTYVTHDPGRSR